MKSVRYSLVMFGTVAVLIGAATGFVHQSAARTASPEASGSSPISSAADEAACQRNAGSVVMRDGKKVCASAGAETMQYRTGGPAQPSLAKTYCERKCGGKYTACWKEDGVLVCYYP